MSQMANVILFSAATSIVLILIIGLSSQVNYSNLPDGFAKTVLENTYFVNKAVSPSTINESDLTQALTNETTPTLTTNSTNTTVANHYFGVDWGDLTSNIGLLNILAAGKKFFITLFSFFTAPVLLMSLFRLPAIVIWLIWTIYGTWWAIAIYGFIRGRD